MDPRRIFLPHTRHWSGPPSRKGFSRRASMKQLLLKKGIVSVEEVPAPARLPKNILVEVSKSLISTGTELSSVGLSGASLFKKAKEKPQEVKKVLQSFKLRGIRRT